MEGIPEPAPRGFVPQLRDAAMGSRGSRRDESRECLSLMLLIPAVRGARQSSSIKRRRSAVCNLYIGPGKRLLAAASRGSGARMMIT